MREPILMSDEAGEAGAACAASESAELALDDLVGREDMSRRNCTALLGLALLYKYGPAELACGIKIGRRSMRSRKNLQWMYGYEDSQTTPASSTSSNCVCACAS